MTAPVLATALAFARHGHPVFPVNWPVERNGKLVCSCGSESRGRPCGAPAKHPYGKLAPNGLRSATTESGIIKGWFGYQAPQANLGVVTDKMVVIDIDPRHGGDESFAELEREQGEMPLTWRALTGGGGEHVLFSAPDGIEITSFAAAALANPPVGRGIDIRARGGYVVAPPSRHMSGRSYAWSVDHHPADVPLAQAPDWLVKRLACNPASTGDDNVPVSKQFKRSDDSSDAALARGFEPVPTDAWTRLTQAPITEYRDMAAARIAGHLFRHSCDYQLVRGLLHAWNSAWCKPPLGYRELDQILDRIADKEAHRIEREIAR